MMDRVYKGQSALRIILKTFTDLGGIIAAVIKYRKPDGSAGEFQVEVVDAAKGVILHECLEGEIDAAGWWAFWAFITFEDGRTATGETAKVYIWDEGG
jgi:hypothetical protein